MLENERDDTDVKEIEVDSTGNLDENTSANQTGGDEILVETEAGASKEDDQFIKAESATQKRIDRLTKKMRTAEREREEALRYAQKVV